MSCPDSAANRSRFTSKACSRPVRSVTLGSIWLRCARRALSSSSWLEAAACSSSRLAATSCSVCSTMAATARASSATPCRCAACSRLRSFNASMRARRSAASLALSRSSPACRLRDSPLRLASVHAIFAATSCSRVRFSPRSSVRSRSSSSSKSACSAVDCRADAKARLRSSSLR